MRAAIGDILKTNRAMWLMLQQEEPGDYVIATERTVTVADICRKGLSPCFR